MTREIHISLRKTLPIVAASLVFALGGCWIILHAEAFAIRLLGGWLNLLFFGGGGLFLLAIALFRKRPLLIISDKGLLYNTLLRPNRDMFFPWHTITEFRAAKVQGQPMILICVVDFPERYDRTGKVARAAMRFSMMHAETPYAINLRNLDCPAGELLELLNDHLAEYRRRHGSA